jgi:hypothetical protein
MRARTETRKSKNSNSQSPKPKKTKRTAEETSDLMAKAIELKSGGANDFVVAKTLGIHASTVKKWWSDFLGTVDTPEPEQFVKSRILNLERCVSRALADYHSGQGAMKDVATAVMLADKYNGVADYLNRQLIESLPNNSQPLLHIVVQNVEIEYPPEDDDDNDD